jgi:hypothetical protein
MKFCTRVFGCKAFAYNFDITRKKLDDKARAGILVGYELTSAAYRVYIPSQRKIMKSGHVVFHERSNNNSIWGVSLQSALDCDWDLQLTPEGDSRVVDVADRIDPTSVDFQTQVQDLIDAASPGHQGQQWTLHLLLPVAVESRAASNEITTLCIMERPE